MSVPISHAIVLPDHDFMTWLDACRPYMKIFERVAVVRSPAGNDLNRFRAVTAVQAPMMWMDNDALAHIRRIYPLVVRVDVIPVQTPAQLQAALSARMTARDRFGESMNTPRHIFDRFALDWPTPARPARVIKMFSAGDDNGAARHEGLDISAWRGVDVNAGAAGQVTRIVPSSDALNYGAYVQVSTRMDDVTYITTYANLQSISVSVGQSIKPGERLASAAGDSIKIVVQRIPGGMSGFQLPNVIDPTLLLYWQDLRVRPTVSALRVRSHAGTFGKVLGMIHAGDALETGEVHGRTLGKLGVDGQWLRVRYPGARQAFTAAWYLESFGLNDPVEGIPGVPMPGVNLDIDHPNGNPPANQLEGMGWVRLVYNVSFNPNAHGDHRYGNTDPNATFQRYRTTLEHLRSAGLRVILVLNHQTFGEGQGYVWPRMDRNRWREFTGRFVGIIRQVAGQFAGSKLISAYQIWNEQDTPPEHARAAVAMPPEDYGHLLAETIKAIRAVDTKTPIITGGHVLGPEAGSMYMRAALNMMPDNALPDGIGVHPYGRGPAGNPFSIHGPIGGAVQIWSRVLPGKPIWITEWGVLDRSGDDSIIDDVNRYATGFLNVLRRDFPQQVAAAVWYAWGDDMDNCYGLVRRNGQPRTALYNTLRSK